MEDVRLTNEQADEPHEIAALVKDCADGSADEDITRKWIERVKASVRSGLELLETIKA